MDGDQREILLYLKSWPRLFVSGREICRRAGSKRRYREDPRWALPILSRMVEDGLIESDSHGHYRFKQPAPERKRRRWIAPHFARILLERSKDFDSVIASDLNKPGDP